jgi:PAS domain S-box-containing protein
LAKETLTKLMPILAKAAELARARQSEVPHRPSSVLGWTAWLGTSGSLGWAIADALLALASLFPILAIMELAGLARAPKSLPNWTLQQFPAELSFLIVLLYIYIAFQRLRYRRQNELFRAVSENAADMIALVEVTGKRLYNSPAYEKVLGYSPRELAATSSLEQIHPEDREKVITAASEARATAVGKRLEYRMRHKDGSYRVLESTASPILNHKGIVTRLVIVNRDITERKRIEEQLEHNAFHDSLTGLPNRSLFLDRLQCAMARAKRDPDHKFAVLFLDIDGLKIFNETMGHAVVDQLIIEVGRRLMGCLRRDDTVSRTDAVETSGAFSADDILARMDGDEFTILLEGLRDPSDPMRVAIRVQDSLKLPFTANGLEVFTSASIGVAMSTPAYQKPADILRDADIAMCRAKARGTSRCEVFDTEMHAAVVRRLKLETELRKAIDREELCVFYQPIVRLATCEITGFESLVRWRHPESSLIGPVDFIEVAEQTGLIIPIGRWVLREACRQARAWQLMHPFNPPLTATVNVSPRQFSQTNLVAEVVSAVRETGIDPKTLQLEITESTAMSDPVGTGRILTQLQEIGVSVSIDDFGTGYSSLSRLRRFPVNVLKIDRSFISGIETDNESREIVHLIVMLARHLNLKVIAEGIETEAQQAYLKEFCCEFGQGYLYSAPVEREKFQELLATGISHVMGECVGNTD